MYGLQSSDAHFKCSSRCFLRLKKEFFCKRAPKPQFARTKNQYDSGSYLKVHAQLVLKDHHAFRG